MGKLKASDDVHVVELGKKPEVIFGLSYQALILGVIGLAVVVIFAILIGGAIGGWGKHRADTTKPGKGLGVVAPSGKGVPAKGDAAVESGTSSRTNPLPPGTYYCVQVLSVANTAERLRALDEDMEFLKTMRVAPLVKQVNLKGDRVSLFAGAFTREQKADAEVLASRLRMMIFRNRKEFKDAQVVSVK